MIDYLEERLDNASRLLEQVRRSERELSGPEQPGKQTRGDAFAPDGARIEHVLETGERVFNSRENVNQGAAAVDDRTIFQDEGEPGKQQIVNRVGRSGGELTFSGQTALNGEGAAPAVDAAQRAEDGSAREGAVLAAQLEHMDRAAAVPAGGGLSGGDEVGRRGGYPVSPAGSRPGTVYPRAAGTPGEERAAAGSAADIRPGFGGDDGWAEQTDRAFRRDSRRYDGGFYLY